VSQCWLADMYVQGKGAPRDPMQAAFWYRRSAEQGNAAAQHHLGVLYERGDGLARDAAQAAAWYRRAADQGNAEAERKLDALLNSCSTAVAH
jgi:TPR repeat protein